MGRSPDRSAAGISTIPTQAIPTHDLNDTKAATSAPVGQAPVPERVAWLRHPTDSMRRLRFKVACLRATAQADAIVGRVLGDWDHDAFIARFAPYWDPFPTKRPAKYLHLETMVRLAALRYVAMGLFHEGRPKRVLDVGCGTGYFLAVCRSEGHDVLGIDLDDEPLYNEMVDFLDLPRVVHRVTQADPLPVLDGSFDIISAFEVVFSFGRPPETEPWDGRRWLRLFEAWAQALAPGGRIVIGFNRDPRTGRFYPPELRRLLADSAGLEGVFFGPYVMVARTTR